jgi:hypothetical protein
MTPGSDKNVLLSMMQFFPDLTPAMMVAPDLVLHQCSCYRTWLSDGHNMIFPLFILQDFTARSPKKMEY